MAFMAAEITTFVNTFSVHRKPVSQLESNEIFLFVAANAVGRKLNKALQDIVRWLKNSFKVIASWLCYGHPQIRYG